MAHDLIFGKIDRDWSLGGTVEGLTDEVDSHFTEEESAMLTKAADLKARAEGGDKDAKVKLAHFTRKVASVKAKATKGDVKAARVLEVLKTSGIFNPTQKIAVSGWSPFGGKPESLEDRERRRQQFVKDINGISKPEDIEKFSRLIAFDPTLKEEAGNLARKGNVNALKIVSYIDPKAKTATAGESDRERDSLRSRIQQLQKKGNLSELERRELDADAEKLTRLEAMSGIGAFFGRSNKGQRRAKHQQHLQQLKTRAASGDQQAIARLQRMQANLSMPGTTSPTVSPAATSSSVPPAGLTQEQIQRYYPAYAASTAQSLTPTSSYPTAYPTAYPSAYPTATPTGYPTTYPTGYPSATPQYAYQSPYYNESLAQNPYGPLPQPTIDVYQGEEEAALAGDGGRVERAAMNRTSSCGSGIPNRTYRTTILKQAIRSAGGKPPTTRDFFKAKAAVDKVIGKAGISLFLPGAQPGRRTV